MHDTAETREHVLDALFEVLTPREAKIVQLRLLVDRLYTYEEIGREFHVGPQRIRQIFEKACRKLRHITRKAQFNLLKDYYEALAEGERKNRLERALDLAPSEPGPVKLRILPVSRETEKQLKEHWPHASFQKNSPHFFVIPHEDWSENDWTFLDTLVQEKHILWWEHSFRVIRKNISMPQKRIIKRAIEHKRTDKTEEEIERMMSKNNTVFQMVREAMSEARKHLFAFRAWPGSEQLADAYIRCDQFCQRSGLFDYAGTRFPFDLWEEQRKEGLALADELREVLPEK